MIAAHSHQTVTAPAIDVLDHARLRACLVDAGERALNWLGRALCGLRGHAMMLHFESTRLSLHCASCGRTTPGWAVAGRRQALR